MSHIDLSNLSELLELLNQKNVLVFEDSRIKVTLNPSGPPMGGELAPVPWRDDE